MDLPAIQAALGEQGFDGWLLCDFRNRDFLAYRVLGLDFEKLHSRRWYYYIPAKGTPKGLASAVEPAALGSLPGTKKIYLSWKDLDAGLKWLLGAKKKIAMQYSPKNNVPYISLVDAGTIELVKTGGHKIVSSADLLQQFVSVIGDEGYRLHKEAGAVMDGIRAEAFEEIAKAIRTKSGATEYDVQQYIMRRFAEEHLTTYSPPMVGVNDHPADPHFDVTKENARPFKPGDTVLIDMWAKKDVPDGIYYDITWSGYIGDKPPAKYQEIFDVVVCGRDTAIAFVQRRVAAGKPVFGWEVDDACRNVVKKAGYGKCFLHRTGHAIDTATHGDGANIDNLETKDDRRLLPGCCFSIEPGIYLAGKMAVRTEINMFIRPGGVAEVTGKMQKALVLIR
jgi:Xaa-Pro aminopeptidase